MNETFKDFTGVEGAVGDWVIFTRLYYRNLSIGKVIRITPQTVLIEHTERGYTGTGETRQAHSQVVLIKEENVPTRYKFTTP